MEFCDSGPHDMSLISPNISAKSATNTVACVKKPVIRRNGRALRRQLDSKRDVLDCIQFANN